MARDLRFDEDTELAVAEPVDIGDVHLKDLSFVLDVEHDGEHVDRCVLDLKELLRAVTVYSAQDKFTYGWRRRWRDTAEPDPD